MKQYIKAAYDSSMPDWLSVNTDGSVDNSVALYYLRHNYAMGSAKFYSEPQPNSVTIYLLYNTYTEKSGWEGKYKSKNKPLVYIPENADAYSDIWISTGERYRRLETTTKARFDDLIVDTTYMVAQPIGEIRDTRKYIDPRYHRYYKGNNNVSDSYEWRYSGQYADYHTNWDSKKHMYVPDKTQPPRRYRNYDSDYDKSGYRIPTPEELYKRLYEKVPDKTQASINRVKKIINEYYEKLNKAKKKILSGYDIRKGKTIDIGYGSALSDLNNGINYYRRLCQGFDGCINEDGSVDADKLAKYISGQGYDEYSLPNCTSRIDQKLNDIETKLKRGY